MGNSETVSETLLQSNVQWLTIQQKRRDIPGFPSLCQAENGSLEADCYDITVQSTVNEHLETLVERKRQAEHGLVNVLDVRLKKKQLFECNIKERLEVYTQKIICRLDEISLTQKEALFILKKVLYAFSQLQKIVKLYFIANPKMIAFNNDGEVKIWLNENFGESQVRQQSLARSQYQMLISIVKCFQGYGIKVQQFYNFLKIEALLSFLNQHVDNRQNYHLRKTIQQKVKNSELPQHSPKMNSQNTEKSDDLYVQRVSHQQLLLPVMQTNFKADLYQKQPITYFKENISPAQPKLIVQNNNLPFDSNSILQRQRVPFARKVTFIQPKKQSLKQISPPPTSSTLSFSENSQKYVHSAPQTSTTIQFSKHRNRSYECLEAPTNTECEEFNERTKQRAENAIKPPTMGVSLNRHYEQMSRITQRSEEGDASSYIGSTRRLSVEQKQEQSPFRNSQISHRSPLLRRNSSQQNYFTKIDL